MKGQNPQGHRQVMVKLSALAASAGVAAALALWWDYRFWDPIALSLQGLMAGSTAVSGMMTAFLLAFAAGASMIVTA